MKHNDSSSGSQGERFPPDQPNPEERQHPLATEPRGHRQLLRVPHGISRLLGADVPRGHLLHRGVRVWDDRVSGRRGLVAQMLMGIGCIKQVWMRITSLVTHSLIKFRWSTDWKRSDGCSFFLFFFGSIFQFYFYFIDHLKVDSSIDLLGNYQKTNINRYKPTNDNVSFDLKRQAPTSHKEVLPELRNRARPGVGSLGACRQSSGVFKPRHEIPPKSASAVNIVHRGQESYEIPSRSST